MVPEVENWYVLGSLLSAMDIQNSAIEPIEIAYFKMIPWKNARKREGEKNIQSQINCPWPNTLIEMPKFIRIQLSKYNIQIGAWNITQHAEPFILF